MPAEMPTPHATAFVVDGRLHFRFDTSEGTAEVVAHPSQLHEVATMFGIVAAYCTRTAYSIDKLYARFDALRELAPDAKTPREIAEALGYDFDELIRHP